MPEVAFWPALALAAFGAFLDAKQRRLPNLLCAALAVAALAGLAFAEGIEVVPWGVLHALIALFVGMALFGLGMIGGGDAKFYAAAALAVPATNLSDPMSLLGWVSASGLALLVVMMVWRRIEKRPTTSGIFKGWEVPYGVAIAAGLWLWVLF